MNKKVLSIDIDVFFNCNEYAKLINHDIDSDKAWKMVEALGVDYKPNYELISKTSKIIKEKCQKAKLELITEHDGIIKVLKDNNIEKCDMYNMDFHNDITYGNNDDELNIENWVRHAKHYGLVENYNWICRPLSGLCTISPFLFSMNCLEDLKIDMLPQFDLVVISISKHFTPIKYQRILPNALMSVLDSDLIHFKEVVPTSEFLHQLKGLDDYLVDGTLPNIYKLYECNKLFLIVERGDKEIYISMVNFGKESIFKCKELVDKFVLEYGTVNFDWKEGIRNEKYIKRLIKNYDIIKQTGNSAKIGGKNNG